MLLFKQYDNAWKNLRLGNSKYKMKNQGCVVCCLASLACYYGKAETPRTLLKRLRFTQSGLVYWNSLSSIYSDIKFIKRIRGRNSYIPHGNIDYYLDRGYPVILEVRLKGYRHFVLAYEKRGSNYMIVDSVLGYKGSMRRKYQKFYGYAVYQGTVPAPEPKLKPKPTNLNIKNSIVDYLKYRKLRSNFGARHWYFRKAFGSRWYCGNAKQNRRLLAWAKRYL